MKKIFVKLCIAALIISPLISVITGCIAPDYQHRETGILLINQGKYEECIIEFTRSLELNRSDAQSYLNRGIAYFNLQRYDLTIQDCSKAIEIDPNLIAAYRFRGISSLIFQDYDIVISREWVIELISHSFGNFTYKLRVSDESDQVNSFNVARK